MANLVQATKIEGSSMGVTVQANPANGQILLSNTDYPDAVVIKCVYLCNNTNAEKTVQLGFGNTGSVSNIGANISVPAYSLFDAFTEGLILTGSNKVISIYGDALDATFVMEQIN